MDVLMTLKESLIWVCMSNIECVPIVIEFQQCREVRLPPRTKYDY